MTRPEISAITFLRLFSDDDGESHFQTQLIGDQHTAEDVESKYIGSGAEFNLRVVPAGWERDWGPTIHATLAIYISGTGIVESSDGDQRPVHPGVVLFAEDSTGRGHTARVTGDQPLAVAHIKLSKPPRP